MTCPHLNDGRCLKAEATLEAHGLPIVPCRLNQFDCAFCQKHGGPDAAHNPAIAGVAAAHAPTDLRGKVLAPPAKLAVVAALFNPAGWSVIPAKWRTWRQQMQPLLDSGRISHCVTAEAVYPGQAPTVDTTSGDLVIYANDWQRVWQKERLINLAVASLPPDVTHVAWLDTDLEFQNPHWPEETIAVLERADVVQLFDAIERGRNPENTDIQFLEAWAAPRDPQAKIHRAPGGAWAARRSTFEAMGGLYDRNIIGGGDDDAVRRWSGQPLNNRLTPAHHRHCMAWSGPLRIGHVRGTIWHPYHGEFRKRYSVERQDILLRHNYDPAADVRVANNGLMEIVGRPALAREVAQYFEMREESDGTSGRVQAAEPPALMAAARKGVGSAFSWILKDRFGAKAHAGCSCDSLKREMDKQGPAWCQENSKRLVAEVLKNAEASPSRMLRLAAQTPIVAKLTIRTCLNRALAAVESLTEAT